MKRVLFLTLLLFLSFSLSTAPIDFSALEARTALSGVFLLLDAEEVLVSKQFGYKDHEQKLGFDEHTLFCLGSVTKSMVAMALQKYVHEEQRVAHFLPHLTNIADYTIADLLHHRTSLVRDLTDIHLVSPYQAIELADLVTLINQKGVKPVEGPPSYSNANYQVLAHILQKASKLSFADALKQGIFDPLSMHESRALDSEAPVALAQGHSRNLQGLKHYHFSTLAGSGNVVVSANDLVRFAQAVLTDYFGEPNSLWGWNKGLFFEIPYLEHTGHLASGHAACLRMFPDEKKAVIILMNKVEPDIIELADAMSASLLGIDPPVRNRASSGCIDPALLEGRYRSEDGLELKVENRHGILTILGAGMPPIFLKHVEGGIFYDPAHPLFTHRFLREEGEQRPLYYLDGLVQGKVFFPIP